MARPEVLQSRSNPTIRRIRDLRRRGDDELMLLEGFTLLEEALACGIVPLEVLMTPAACDCARGRDLVARLEHAARRPRQLEERLLASLSELETGQGVLAVTPRPHFTARDFLAGTPLIVVAVELQNPGNLGALLRTAEAAGATGAYLTPGTADPLSPKALRGAMGSAFRLPHLRGLTPDEICRRLRQQGVTAVAAVARAGDPPDRVDLRRPVAFFLGNEGSGLPLDVTGLLDLQVHIPLHPPVESLNVSVAAGVLLFEAARQRRQS